MPLLWSLPLLMAACTGEPEKPAQPPAEPVVQTPTEEAPAPALALSDLQGGATMDALVPSPAETQRALANAGLTTSLAKMAEGRDFKVEVADNDEVAVRTGVVLAHVVLGAKDAPAPKLVSELGMLKTGLQKLGAKEKILTTIDDLSARVANDATSRDDLVREMDELANVMVPEVEYAVGDRALPLLRAGAWLEGAWLVSGAIIAEKRFDVATSLLRQPAVVSYFKDYLYGPGKAVAPAAINTELQATLAKLETITAKDTLTAEDVTAIHDATNGLLSKLEG